MTMRYIIEYWSICDDSKFAFTSQNKSSTFNCAIKGDTVVRGDRARATLCHVKNKVNHSHGCAVG